MNCGLRTADCGLSKNESERHEEAHKGIRTRDHTTRTNLAQYCDGQDYRQSIAEMWYISGRKLSRFVQSKVTGRFHSKDVALSKRRPTRAYIGWKSSSKPEYFRLLLWLNYAMRITKIVSIVVSSINTARSSKR